jgi:OmpA-OmpF porin, OOP family
MKMLLLAYFFMTLTFPGYLKGQDSLSGTYTIKFSGYQSGLSKKARGTLREAAKELRNQPEINFAVTVYCSVTENQRLSVANWDRINNIINYFVKKQGIHSNRFIFKYGAATGDCNIVDIIKTEDTLATSPLPHPSLRKKKDKSPQ